MRPRCCFWRIYSVFVSIHASVKDATNTAFDYCCRIGFNPRICKRCDSYCGFDLSSKVSFNPRICKRCDGNPNTPVEMLTVSIHASVKDATMMAVVPDDLLCVSIHASVKDATAGSFQSSSLSSVSIHASVKDATDSQRPNISMTCFNPRICKRCDFMKVLSRINPNVSIHASVKDATLPWLRAGQLQRVSIHASVKDATKPMLWLLVLSWFQSTHL